MFVVECKDLEGARTPFEMGNELANFFVGTEQRRSIIDKHQGRVRWIADNLDEVLRYFEIVRTGKWKVGSLIVIDRELFTPFFESPRAHHPSGTHTCAGRGIPAAGRVTSKPGSERTSELARALPARTCVRVPLLRCSHIPCMREVSGRLGRRSIGPRAGVRSYIPGPRGRASPGTRPVTRPRLRTIGWASSPHHKGGAATMGTVTGQSVGIDISENFLDVYLHPAGEEMRIPHNDEGTASLLELLRGFDIERVVLESTGDLQRRLVRSLQEAGYAVSVVNPERIWAYRRLVGRVAKTDRIDARLIAEYGATMRPAASVPLSKAQHAMRELTSRRDQLIEAVAAEKKRLRRVSHEAVRASLELQIGFLEREVKRLESAIEAAVSGDEATRTTAEILVSIPGVGKLTANLMAIDLPELGRLGDKQIASRAGVAPHPDESSKYRGRACIRGGRARVRAKLYMAAFNARKYNPVIKAFYARLEARGKTFKQAMTACMRKLLVLMNTLVARGVAWNASCGS